MKILLAGHNIDREIICNYKRCIERTSDFFNSSIMDEIQDPEKDRIFQDCQSILQSDNLTPETISAAYARISRDPRPVDLLRDESRNWVSKARRSNQNIVFGLGHSSIAEHAVFNIDIIGVSRYLMELIQQHRLCSFTEKSQRYIKLGRDYIVPEEILNGPLHAEFESFTLRQFERYEAATKILKECTGKEPAETGEDARYLLPFCVTTQTGMTLNARSLEYLLQNAASSNLQEYRIFGETLFKVIDKIAPSIIKYASLSEAILQRNAMRWPFEPVPSSSVCSAKQPVTLISMTPAPDDEILKGILLRCTGLSIVDGDTVVKAMDQVDKMQIFVNLYRSMKPWEAPPREFELVQMQFEVIISAAAYGQLKRHRMTTQIFGPYDLSLGVTTPPLFQTSPVESILKDSVSDSERLYLKIYEMFPLAAPYALIGSHRRRVLVQLNARELFHLSRLREDIHAQWDIRNIVRMMTTQAARKMPLACLMTCGKNDFEARYEALLNSAADAAPAPESEKETHEWSSPKRSGI